MSDPSRWQPLRLPDGTVQQYLTPHWRRVRPFALWSASFRPSLGLLRNPTVIEMQQLIDMSAALDDTTKSLVDYWAASLGTVSPPGQWMQIAESVSVNDGHTLDQDVKPCGDLVLAKCRALLEGRRV